MRVAQNKIYRVCWVQI